MARDPVPNRNMHNTLLFFLKSVFHNIAINTMSLSSSEGLWKYNMTKAPFKDGTPNGEPLYFISLYSNLGKGKINKQSRYVITGH